MLCFYRTLFTQRYVAPPFSFTHFLRVPRCAHPTTTCPFRHMGRRRSTTRVAGKFISYGDCPRSRKAWPRHRASHGGVQKGLSICDDPVCGSSESKRSELGSRFAVSLASPSSPLVSRKYAAHFDRVASPLSSWRKAPSAPSTCAFSLPQSATYISPLRVTAISQGRSNCPRQILGNRRRG